ncbi:MAG: antitoxin [Cryobacterium sp.]|nr:antitoxin [Cryobacterium sp.]MBX3090255.1 antitoxin [Cryobacterium sp.]MCO5293601.1 ribbon-helix-helix domain-containing protein [Homoserinimonas sp.]MCW5944702.1 antitoxin [Cryobacterium sp.]
MKISVSLPVEAVEFLDEQTRSGVYPTRSAALSSAVAVLRQWTMRDSYAEAWDEWEASGENEVWRAVLADGLASGQ